ncbi:MAG: GNAT family N-acetyltransferase [Bryobacterales bacterium]|nr:GNAT family N-acetyltransferase [Bryobacterales bacterium]
MSVTFLSAAQQTELIELRHLSGSDLRPLLWEEAEAWREMLDWDFTPSADLVMKFVDLRSLSGFAALVNGRIAGYAYFLSEDRKGLIGDVYVRKEHRTFTRENSLLQAVMEELANVCAVRRVESQLMMLDSPLSRPMVFEAHMREFRRTFMAWEPGFWGHGASRAEDILLFETWREERLEESAQMIALAYRDHIDSQINDQYQSVSGARRFLSNIIQFPGCGRFFAPASCLAFRKDTGLPCGLILGSLVNEGVGHITQICVTPESRGLGIGYELLRRALREFGAAGCRKVSLTVTSSNTSAIRLYERMGFRRVHEFGAHVWAGF